MPKIDIEKQINLKEVLAFAKEKHKGQKRDDGSDYINHPMRVAKLVDKYKGQYSKNREVLIAASLLHDTLEDTYTSYREIKDHFGDAVASIVLELTTAKYASKLMSKAMYLAKKMQMMTNYALTIKLADRLDNLSDLEHSSEDKKTRTINDTKYILDYIEKYRALTKTQQKFVEMIRQKICELEEIMQK